jgi:hypothetical protein
MRRGVGEYTSISLMSHAAGRRQAGMKILRLSAVLCRMHAPCSEWEAEADAPTSPVGGLRYGPYTDVGQATISEKAELLRLGEPVKVRTPTTELKVTAVARINCVSAVATAAQFPTLRSKVTS